MKTIDILRSALGEYGYTFTTYRLGRDQKSFTKVHNPEAGAALTFSTDSPLYPFSTASSRLICNNKAMAYEFADLHGVNTPQSVYVYAKDSMDAALNLLETRGRVIVKPGSSSLSNGLTLDVTDSASLVAAITKAFQFSDSVIVQEQIIGDEIRFVVVDGATRAAILRQTPRIVGDGVSTVSELIEWENNEREKITDTMVAYPAIDGVSAGVNASAVPENGQVLELGRGTMIKDGASMYDVFAHVDRSYIEHVDRLASALGKGFVVVDMMVKDYKQPALQDNYAFIEFNSTPALQLFYSCRDGQHFKVAEDYLAPMINKVIRGNYL